MVVGVQAAHVLEMLLGFACCCGIAGGLGSCGVLFPFQGSCAIHGSGGALELEAPFGCGDMLFTMNMSLTGSKLRSSSSHGGLADVPLASTGSCPLVGYVGT